MKNKIIIQIIFLVILFAVAFYLGHTYKGNFSFNYTCISKNYPIDIEEQKCINSSNAIDYSICSQNAENAWDKEIQKNLEQLKSIMPPSDFRYIEEINTNWIKYANAKTAAIDKFIFKKDGIIYQTIGSSILSDIKKEYAIFLDNIYLYYKENN